MEIKYRSQLERAEHEHKESLEDLKQRAQVAERRCEQLEMEIQTLKETHAADVEAMNAAHERAMMEVVIDHQTEVQGLQDDLVTSRAASVVTQRDVEDVERLLENSRRMDIVCVSYPWRCLFNQLDSPSFSRPQELRQWSPTTSICKKALPTQSH